MAVEKILQKIKVQIAELSGTLESFVDQTIQPSVEDCDRLRMQMNALLEDLAVYKYRKLNNEISPSFNIHAKVSARVSETNTADEPEQTQTAISPPEKPADVIKSEIKNSETNKLGSPLLIGINDKFRFINELFSQNNSEYNIVLEQLTNLHTWPETDLYLNSLKNVYGWKDSNEVVKYFYSLVKKRFD